MAYQALYRKWRPETFHDMVGQEHIVKTLQNQIMTGHVAHAYLFCGSRGTGKTSTAKIMARAINCEKPVNGDACGVCPTCAALKGERDLDILEIDAASNNGVDEIRDLRDKVKYPPQYGRYKVYIIDEVHMLSTAAFNALLKTLEEPPEHVVFILATTEPQKLPATILSRCQRFDFGRFTAKELSGRLQEAADGAGVSITGEALMMIARAAEGGMRDALSVLDICISYDREVTAQTVRRVLGTADRAFLFDFSKALSEENLGEVMRRIDQLMRDGKEPQVFLRDLGRHTRALLMAKTAGGDLQDLLEITDEDAAMYQKESDGFSTARLIRMLEIFQDAEGSMRYAASPRTALEIACVKACTKTQDADAQALLERIDTLEKELTAFQKALESGQVAVKAALANAPADRPRPTRADTPAAAAPTVAKGQAAWDEAKKELRKVNPAMYANLSTGRFAGLFGNVYRYALPEGQEVFLKILNKDDNRQQFSQILARLSGQEAVFEAVLDAPKPDLDREKRMDMAQKELQETFGRDKFQEVSE